MSRRGIAAVAEHERVDLSVESREELLADRFLDEQARAGEAHLARVVELPRRPVRSGVEIAVGEHDQRTLATELGGERHDVLGRGPCRCGAAVAGEPVNVMRRTPGSATSAAPTSSPMPCTRL